MEKSATQYLVEAVAIIRENINYILILILLDSAILLLYFNFVVESLKNFLPLFLPSWLPFFLLIAPIIALILFYGQFIEIINYGRKDKWINIFNNYWLKLFLAILILRGPTAILNIVAPELYVLNNILFFILSIVSIYILPLVPLKRDVLRSFPLGVKCLLGNFKFSSPLIVLIICLFLFPFMSLLISNYTNSQYLVISFSMVYSIFKRIIEFSVFIAAGLILKEKLLSE